MNSNHFDMNIETFASADKIKCAIKDEQRVLYSPDGKWLYGTAHPGIKSLAIRPGTEIIADLAFFFPNQDIHHVIVPNGVIAIGKWAFAGFHFLLTVELPDSLEHIGEEIFKFCHHIVTIFIPKGTKDKFGKLLPDYKSLLVEK